MRTVANVAIALCLAGVIAYIVYAMVKSNAPTQQTQAAVRELRRLAENFPAPSFAQRVGSHDVIRPAAAAIGTELLSRQGTNVIYAYYAGELAKRGWKRCGPAPDPNDIPDNNYFERGPYEAALQFSPENSGRYTFAFEWGVYACRNPK